MKMDLRLITAVIAVVLASAAVAEATHSRSLDEDAALALLQRTLKRDQIYEKRISLDCIAYGTEETTNAYFEFVLREIHNTKCGGDPDASPLLIVTAFIAVPGKSSSGKQLKTNGTLTRARKLSSIRTQVAPAEAGAIMISADSNGGDRRLRSNVFKPLPSLCAYCTRL